MKNYSLSYILLNEIHNSAVSKAKLVRLFGSDINQDKNIKLTMNKIGSKEFYGRVDLKAVEIRSRIAKEKVFKARQLIKLISWIPWIKMIAISGSVAFDNSEKSDDIDLFVVTDSNRVWITRFIEASIFSLLKVRRRWGQSNVKDSLCFNYYLGDGFDTWSKACDFIVATELISLKPLFGKEYYSKLLSKNNWILRYFPGLNLGLNNDFMGDEKKVFFDKIFDFLDKILMDLQIYYMKSRGHQNENCKITRNELCFYEEDWSEKALILDRKLKEFKSQ